MKQTSLYVEASEDLPQACKPDSVKRLFEVYEVLIALVIATLAGLFKKIAQLEFSYLYIEACEDLRQAYVSDSVKRLLEVCKVVQQTALVQHVLLYDESTIGNLFYCTPAWCKTCLFF